MAKNKKDTVPIALKLMHLMFRILTPLMPGVMARYAYQLWFTPTRFKAPKKEQEIAQKAKTSFIMIDNQKIKLWSWGEGPTVLFIHGWGGRGTQISSFVGVLNQAGFNVMSFDMPAHGQSEGKKTNVFRIANAVSEIINRIDNLHSIITHSFGGVIFGNFYNPKLSLKKVVMICPPSTVFTALNQFSQTLQLPKSIQSYIENQLKKDFGDDIFDKLSLMENGQKITQPVLVVHDKDDDIVPYQDGQAIVTILKNGTFLGTQKLGHRKVLFYPTVIKRISQFIQTP
jgi:pimeloyl-ACP methyl ester carboxylesterase